MSHANHDSWLFVMVFVMTLILDTDSDIQYMSCCDRCVVQYGVKKKEIMIAIVTVIWFIFHFYVT